jgi:hypothetical protein
MRHHENWPSWGGIDLEPDAARAPRAKNRTPHAREYVCQPALIVRARRRRANSLVAGINRAAGGLERAAPSDSGNNVLDDAAVDVCQAEVSARVTIGEMFVVEAQKV